MANRNKKVTERELQENYTDEELSVIHGKKKDSDKLPIPVVINSYFLKIEPSTLPKELILLHGFMANQGTASQRHGLFTYMDYNAWEKYFSNITLNEMTRILALERVSNPLGLSHENKESFIYHTRRKRGEIVKSTLEEFIKVFSEAPDFVNMENFFGGLEYGLIKEKNREIIKEKNREIADFLFNVPLPIFVQATALYLMDSYHYRQKTMKKYKKTFLGEELVIAGGENYFINLKKLEKKGLTLKELSRPEREYLESEIEELIRDGVLIENSGEQKFSMENLYDFEWNYVRYKKGLGTSDSLAFAFSSYIFGPWGPIVLRLHDNLDTIVKGVEDYTYTEYRGLLDSAENKVNGAFKKETNIDFSSNYGEFDEILAAAMITGNEKVRELFLNFLSSGAIEKFIYLIAKNNVPYEKYVDGNRLRFKSSIGMRHNHNLYELISDFKRVNPVKEGYINGRGRVRYSSVENNEEEYYHNLVNNPLFGFLAIGQLQPFYSDMPADWSKIDMGHVAEEFYRRLHHAHKNRKLLLERKELSLKGYPYKIPMPVFISGFPKTTKPILEYF